MPEFTMIVTRTQHEIVATGYEVALIVEADNLDEAMRHVCARDEHVVEKNFTPIDRVIEQTLSVWMPERVVLTTDEGPKLVVGIHKRTGEVYEELEPEGGYDFSDDFSWVVKEDA